MIVGHIGARKGSKGVPGKNFRTLHGKPLIDWSLDQLLGNTRIDVVIVSTDDEDIYQHARDKHTLDIGMRPPELCTDTASKWMVWQHALKVTEAIAGPVSVFVDLDCTSPLRLDSDIDAALAQYAAKEPDMLMSCCAARNAAPIQRNCAQPSGQNLLTRMCLPPCVQLWRRARTRLGAVRPNLERYATPVRFRVWPRSSSAQST